MEAAMPLYGHEMDDDVSPLETGLGFAVKMKKEDFIGKKALEEHAELTRKRVGLEVIGRGKMCIRDRVQASIWPEEMKKTCKEHNIVLL